LMSPHRLNPEEVFEDEYTDLFVSRFRRRGVTVKYERDRGARDIGIHLTAPGSLDLSDVRVWFQLKGLHSRTLSAERLAQAASVPVSLDVEDIKKWYAAPEAVYIVVYLEARNEFIAEDLRDLVDQEFADWKGTFASKMEGLSQKTVTLHVSTDSVFDEAMIRGLLRHKSMRVDGPAWRGRPLGHRFDPLRTELANLDTGTFTELAEALLTAHDYRIDRRMDAASILRGVADGTDEAFLSVGTMHSTYEWPFSLGVQYGVSEGTDFREEGQLLRIQGKTAVLVHTRLGSHAAPAGGADATLAGLHRDGVEKFLVIGNAPDVLLLSSYKPLLGDLCDAPQGNGSLAYSVLTAPLIFMEFQDRLKWKFINYLWDDPDRPPVRLR
jgi:hypothetical protein